MVTSPGPAARLPGFTFWLCRFPSCVISSELPSLSVPRYILLKMTVMVPASMG